MKKYWYRAIDSKGMIIKGLLAAENVAHLEKILEGQNKEIIKTGRAFSINFFKTPYSSYEIIELCIQLQSLLEARLPLLETLKSIHAELTNPSLKQAVEETIMRVDGGASLSESFEPYPRLFDKVFINLLRAGEETGKIEESLSHIIDYLKWRERIAAQSKKALSYPLMLVSIIIGVIFTLLTTLIPQFVIFFKTMEIDLPFITTSLLMASHIFSEHGSICLLILSPLLALLFILNKFYRPLRILVARGKLKVPILGKTSNAIILMRFFHMISFMTSSHIQLLKALEISADSVENSYLNETLAAISGKIQEGQKFSEAIKDYAFISPFVRRMIKVGEQSGNLESILRDINYFYEREVDHRATHFLKFLEPALLLFLGSIILWVALAIFYPLYTSLTLMDI